MKDGKPNSAGEPDARRAAPAGRKAGPAKKQRGFVERATAATHSGHGADSVRPHLRDQLRLKALMQQPYSMPEVPHPGKDDHHR